MKFQLDSAALEKIFRVWSLPGPKEEMVLFALRGCLPMQNPKAWVASVAMETKSVDSLSLRCALGIWNRKAARIFVAPGSTVPHRDNVLWAAGRNGPMQGRGTNQMEPGYYDDLRKGEHLQGKPMGHAALRQTGNRFYRRSRHAPPYTLKDPLFFGNPYDNLHCAWNLDGREPGFRSSGCLVVAGLPHTPRLPDSGPNRGAWKTFHDYLYAGRQAHFPMLLLPASEAGAALVSTHPKARLCFGSEGGYVKELQRRLAQKKLFFGRCDGELGVATYRAWNRAGLKGYGDLI